MSGTAVAAVGSLGVCAINRGGLGAQCQQCHRQHARVDALPAAVADASEKYPTVAANTPSEWLPRWSVTAWPPGSSGMVGQLGDAHNKCAPCISRGAPTAVEVDA